MLQDVKALLGLTDDGQDDKLTVIINMVQNRLCAILGLSSVPYELEYIVTEISVMRFNRIGSEGMSSHTVEGESISFTNDDFGPFMDDIDAWKAAQENRTVGVIRFL